MKSDAEFGGAARVLLDRGEVEGVLSGAFYSPRELEPSSRTRVKAERPSHYKVICISMYNGDLDRLDEMVDELKGMGMTKANRSALIRYALAQVDLTKIPRGM